jgi:hypothetical protein
LAAMAFLFVLKGHRRHRHAPGENS